VRGLSVHDSMQRRILTHPRNPDRLRSRILSMTGKAGAGMPSLAKLCTKYSDNAQRQWNCHPIFIQAGAGMQASLSCAQNTPITRKGSGTCHPYLFRPGLIGSAAGEQRPAGELQGQSRSVLPAPPQHPYLLELRSPTPLL
jgi:hypothetical protein